MLATLVLLPNFIFNGDFSLGDVGFVSEHKSVVPVADALYPEGVYAVVANPARPAVLNSCGVADYFDHTTGRANGRFLAVNGSFEPHGLVWEQTVDGLTPGRPYQFGGWVSRWTPNDVPHARFALMADGQPLVEFEDPSEPGVWAWHAATLVARAAKVRLQIRLLTGFVNGNDFGLDDLSLRDGHFLR